MQCVEQRAVYVRELFQSRQLTWPLRIRRVVLELGERERMLNQRNQHKLYRRITTHGTRKELAIVAGLGCSDISL